VASAGMQVPFGAKGTELRSGRSTGGAAGREESDCDASGRVPGQGSEASPAESTRKPLLQAGDVILMDYSMPLMGGAQCARSIRADPRYDGVRIIGVTGNVLLEDQ